MWGEGWNRKIEVGGSKSGVTNTASMQYISTQAQGQLDWWKGILADAASLKSVVANYHARCPKNDGKHKHFPILQWVEETKQEASVLSDGVYEMMSELHYIHFMMKPKNGGVEATVSAVRFRELCDEQDAITDLLGPSTKYLKRVAVKTKDLVIVRDAKVQSRGFKQAEKELRKANEEDVSKMTGRLARGACDSFGDGRLDTAALIMQGRSATANESGAGGSAFGTAGRGAINVGDVLELVDDAEDKTDDEEGKDEEVLAAKYKEAFYFSDLASTTKTTNTWPGDGRMGDGMGEGLGVGEEGAGQGFVLQMRTRWSSVVLGRPFVQPEGPRPHYIFELIFQVRAEKCWARIHNFLPRAKNF